MADLATVFGWSPQTMDEFSLEDLVLWHEKAKRRSEPKKP